MLVEVVISKKVFSFINLYRFQSQAKYDFEFSVKDLELNLEHVINTSPLLFLVLDDFKARSKGWHKNDITSFEGFKIDFAIYRFGLSQILNEPT